MTACAGLGCRVGPASLVLKLSFELEIFNSGPWDLNFMKIQDIDLMLGTCGTKFEFKNYFL